VTDGNLYLLIKDIAAASAELQQDLAPGGS